jgi:hypothetical protein
MSKLPPGSGAVPSEEGERATPGAQRAQRQPRFGNRIEKRIEAENETDPNGEPPIDRDRDRGGLARSLASPEDQRGPVAPGLAGTDWPPT